MSSLLPTQDPELDVDTAETVDEPWECVLHNDPVNLMGFVKAVICKVFGYTPERAAQLMLETHTHGTAIAATGEKAKMEGYATQLHAYRLWATVVQS
jgi:ATP-dependent Clp protease adaptor protein ClpS